MSDFANAISNLVADDDPPRRIRAIKTAIAENFKATDGRVKVDITDHFNHSYVPDFVLSWPSGSEPRRVFLRTSFRENDLMRDLDVLADDRPIIMPLAHIEPPSASGGGPLQEVSQVRRTLITDPYSLEVFDQETDVTPVVSLLSHAVLQGGKGVISSNRAHSISETLSAGFEGAGTADYESTSAAVQATESALDPDRASQLNRLLHAVWVGSGASPSQFPGATGVTAILDPEALKFILDLPDLPDSAFWFRLGRGITTERLCQLGDFSANPNLQRLIDSCVYRLRAKACRIIQAQSGVEHAQWEIVASTLTLRTATNRIHFAPKHAKELPDSSMAISPTSVVELRARAKRAGVDVGEVKLSNGESTLTYASDGRPDVAQDETLAAVEGAISGAKVVSATARIGDGPRTVRCNLQMGIAAGTSNAMFYVTELAWVAVPLLAEMSFNELEEIRETTGQPVVEVNAEVADDNSSDHPS